MKQEVIKDTVRDMFYRHSHDDDLLIAELNGMIAQDGSEVCSAIIFLLTHLELENERAETLWAHILDHYDRVKGSLKRTFSLGAVVCDYCKTVDLLLKNPKMMEMKIFDDLLDTSSVDSMTGLYSRRFMDDALEREVAKVKRYGQPLSLIFFDLDNFKQVNDSYGHLAGDAVLRAVAEVILEEKRTCDICARFGGEEIVFALPGTEKCGAFFVADRIRSRVEKMTVPYGKWKLKVTLSGGVAEIPGDAKDRDGLINQADTALYKAKAAGKNVIAL